LFFVTSFFTGKDEDVVKLYDLTSLCSDLNEDVNQNPFTTPVAMLLFKYNKQVLPLLLEALVTNGFYRRVARNLKMSSDYKRHQGTVLELLKNCLAILDSAKYPQVNPGSYIFSSFFLQLLFNPVQWI